MQQNQQVDIRVGVQLATAITADRDQGNGSAMAFQMIMLPGLLQQLIDDGGAGSDQLVDVMTIKKPLVQHQAGMLQRLAKHRPGLLLTV